LDTSWPDESLAMMRSTNGSILGASSPIDERMLILLERQHEQIKQLQEALKFSSHGAVKALESLKPRDPVFFVSRDATKIDERVAGKQIVAERVATKMYDTPLFALEQSK